MKKFLAMVLALVMALSLVACGGGKDSEGGDDKNSDFQVGFICLHDENSTYDLNFINAAKAACEKLGVKYTIKKNVPETEKAYEADKPKVATGIDSFNDTPSAGTPTTAVGESTGAGAEQYSGTEFDSSDFAWDDSGSSSNTKIFDKRYIAGPSVDELAEEVEKMQQRLQLERHQFVGNNRKYAPRARVNRPRIYR